MIPLSKRQADATKLQSSLERDEQLATLLFNQQLTPVIQQQAIEYVTQAYSCSAADAEEAITHLIRTRNSQRVGTLSNRGAQLTDPPKQIVIPPTTGNPIGRTVPVDKLADEVASPVADPKLTIDATPSDTTDQKVEDVTKPLTDDGGTRQQKLVASIKALKVAIAEVAKDMYSVELLDEGQGKVISKVIDAISAACSEQTAKSVKSLVSPLLGQS